MKNLKDTRLNFKMIAIILLVIIFMGLVIVGIINRDKIVSILDSNMQRENENEDQVLEFLSYKIYDNKDKEHVKVIVSINSENGIEYVKRTDGTIVQANGKNTVGLDYICAVDVEEQVIVKEIGKEEITEKILLTEIGTEELPITINNAEQLLKLQENTDKLFTNDILRKEIYYEVKANIDLSSTNWKPIATREKPFEGILKGNSYTVSNLTYSDIERIDAGIFGYVTGTIENIKLDNCEVTGKENVGVLVGNNNGTITNVQIKNSKVNGTTNTGILIGYNTGTISGDNITVQGEVTATGDNAGGLVGNTTKEISGAVADVTVNGVENVGGIVGYASSNVKNNTVIGTVNATGNNCGGIVGSTISNVIENISDVSVSGIENVGGCIGSSTGGWTSIEITKNKSKGIVEGKNNVGGLAGYGYAEYTNYSINNNYSTSDVNASGNNVSGLIGYIGLWTGYNYSRSITIDKCYSTEKISSTGNYTGGIVGYVSAYQNANGWPAGFYLNITNCFFIGESNGYEHSAGLIGAVNNTRRDSAAVTYITIRNNYANGKVAADENNIADAILSELNWHGKGSCTIDQNYFVPETTGITASDYGVSKNLANMYSQSEFPNWDFENIWTIEEGLTMPYLKNLDKPDEVNK